MALIEQKLSQTCKKAEDLIQEQNKEKEFIYPNDNLIKDKNELNLNEKNNNDSKESQNENYINNPKK